VLAGGGGTRSELDGRSGTTGFHKPTSNTSSGPAPREPS
jgi:hypothetical protein